VRPRTGASTILRKHVRREEWVSWVVFVVFNESFVNSNGMPAMRGCSPRSHGPRLSIIFPCSFKLQLPNFRLFATTRLTGATTIFYCHTILSVRLDVRHNITAYRNGAPPGETGVRGGGDGNGKPPTSCRRNRCLRAFRAMASGRIQVLERLAD
jgi:hypothetical protein